MIPTVKIRSEVSDDNPLGYIVINEEDFDPEVHVKLEDEAPAAEAKPEGRRGRRAAQESAE